METGIEWLDCCCTVYLLALFLSNILATDFCYIYYISYQKSFLVWLKMSYFISISGHIVSQETGVLPMCCYSNTTDLSVHVLFFRYLAVIPSSLIELRSLSVSS